MSLTTEDVKKPTQIARVAGLAHTIWNEHFPAIIGQAQVDYMVAKYQSEAALAQQIREGMRYFLLRVDDRDIGYVALLPEADQRLFLNKFYILANERGRGLARQALRFIESRARAWSCTSVYLRCNIGNTSAIAAYEHLGFKHTGTVVSDIGGGFVMDDVTMEREIL